MGALEQSVKYSLEFAKLKTKNSVETKTVLENNWKWFPEATGWASCSRYGWSLFERAQNTDPRGVDMFCRETLALVVMYKLKTTNPSRQMDVLDVFDILLGVIRKYWKKGRPLWKNLRLDEPSASAIS